MNDQEDLELTMSTAMQTASQYHRYQWDLVSPWLGERVMEIGVGFGQYTRKMIESGKQVLACDLDPSHLDELVENISAENLKTLEIDLESADIHLETCLDFNPDTIVLLNVLEHISDHVGALRFLHRVTSDKGRLVLIVPALGWLYNGLDRQAGHYRRYNRGLISSVLKDAGWCVGQCRFINAPGIPGWFAAGVLSRLSKAKNELDASSTNALIRIYDRLFVQLSRRSDPLIGRLAGLSVFAVATKYADGQ